jgi:type IV secretory pathway TrbD component
MDLNTTPAMAAPPGEVTNFHPGITEIQMKFITVYAGTLAGATVCLALRIWTRARIVRGIWADDCKQIPVRKEDESLTDTIDAIIGAWLMDIGFFISCVEWMKYGFGDHLWNVSLAQLVKYAEVSERPYVFSSLINTFLSDSDSSRYFILLGADAHQVFHTLAVSLESFPVTIRAPPKLPQISSSQSAKMVPMGG